MRTILLWASMAVATFTASALEISTVNFGAKPDVVTPKAAAGSFKEIYQLDCLPAMRTSLTRENIRHRNVPMKAPESELVTDPAGSTSRYAMAVDIFLSNMGATHVGGFGANVTTSDDGAKFFSRAFTLNFFQQGYSEGDVTDDSVVFHSGQYIYDTEDGEKAYMYAAYLTEGEDWPDFCDTFVLTKDEQGRYVSSPGYYFMVMTEEEAERGINPNSDIICFGTNYVFTPLPEDVSDAVLPDDAEVFDCQLFANSLSNYGGSAVIDVTVGVGGDKVYVGGLSDYLPGSYMVGTIGADNTVTFKTGQYIGYHDKGDYPYIYEFLMANPLYSDGESLMFKEADSVTMTFNEQHTMLTMEEGAGVFVCAYGDPVSWNEIYWNMLIGDFNQALTPKNAWNVSCYGQYGEPCITFECDNISEEGLPLMTNHMWCELVINGETYKFLPEYYEGLAEATERIYFNISGVHGLYPGNFTTLYLDEYDGKFNEIKTIGVRIGYECDGEARYSDLIYASGLEPFDDRAFVPSASSEVVYYKEYYNTIRFKFDGKDIDGNPIPDRILGAEVLLDGAPLVFKNSEYYFGGGDDYDVTVIGLSENAPNYSSSLVTALDGEYVISLWGHSEMPEFKTLTVRAVCIGGNAVTYGDACEIELERAAVPANPWDVAYDEDSRSLKFGALPVDVAGNGLAPWNYGYEVFVNGDLYTFNGALYDIENDITLIPYEGFEYNYNFYLQTDRIYDESDWSVKDMKTVMSVAMLDEDLDIKKIGVRAVYADKGGNITYSDIVNSDGSIGTGVDGLGADNAPVRWFNLQGIEVLNPEAGSVYLRRQGGKTAKVFVK